MSVNKQILEILKKNEKQQQATVFETKGFLDIKEPLTDFLNGALELYKKDEDIEELIDTIIKVMRADFEKYRTRKTEKSGAAALEAFYKPHRPRQKGLSPYSKEGQESRSGQGQHNPSVPNAQMSGRNSALHHLLESSSDGSRGSSPASRGSSPESQGSAFALPMFSALPKFTDEAAAPITASPSRKQIQEERAAKRREFKKRGDSSEWGSYDIGAPKTPPPMTREPRSQLAAPRASYGSLTSEYSNPDDCDCDICPCLSGGGKKNRRKTRRKKRSRQKKRKTRKRRRQRTKKRKRRGRKTKKNILAIFKEGRGIKKTPRRRGSSNYTQKHKPSPRVRSAFHKSNR